MPGQQRRVARHGRPIVEVVGLAKRFGDVQAVGGVEFGVREGELFGFLGPNGAGKTTTINMLTGLARPDAGSIRIAGIDCSKRPKAAQHLMGVVPDESNLYPRAVGPREPLLLRIVVWHGQARPRTAGARAARSIRSG